MARNKLGKEYILITSSNFPIGGAGANYLNLFCKSLKINGYYVKVILLKGFSFGNFRTSHKKHNITEDGVPFTYIGFISRPKNAFSKILDDFLIIIKLAAKLFSLLPKRKKTTLLIYNNELHSNIVIYLLARLFTIKIVSFVPEYYDKTVFKGSFLRRVKWYGFLFNFSYLNRLSDRLIVFSHYLKEKYLLLGYEETKIIVQPNLTDFDYWEIKNTTAKYTLGYSGTPTKENGLHDLFKAMSLLKNEGISTSLIVVGDNPFGSSFIPNLKVECEKLNISENVFFRGLVELDEVKQVLSECEILTLTRPSIIQTQAGFPTKLGEYFASRKKVLVTNFGDIEKYFQNGADLVIAQSGDPCDIAKKIKWIIQNDQEAKTLTEAGYKKAELLLEYKNSVKKIVSLID